MNKPKDVQEYDGYEIFINKKITQERRRYLEKRCKEYEEKFGNNTQCKKFEKKSH